MSWLRTWPGPAPSVLRTPTSRVRRSAWAVARFVTLTHAITRIRSATTVSPQTYVPLPRRRPRVNRRSAEPREMSLNGWR